MIPILSGFTQIPRSIIPLKRHYIQAGASAINVSSIAYLGPKSEMPKSKYEFEVILVTAPPLDEWQPGMEAMFRTAANANIASARITRVDNANSKIVVQVTEDGTLYNNPVVANVIPYGLCDYTRDTFDATLVKNNANEVIALQYDENGEFLVRLGKQDFGNDLVAIQICVTETVTVDFKVSLDGINWNTPENWTSLVVAAEGVGLNGVDVCPYGYTKIVYFDSTTTCWLRITTSNLGTSNTYFINLST